MSVEHPSIAPLPDASVYEGIKTSTSHKTVTPIQAKKRVLITCSAKGGIPWWWFSSYDRTLRLDHPEYSFEFAVEAGNTAINISRNIAAQNAIEQNYWKLVQIDCDQFWSPEGLVRLVGHNEAIVAAPYCKKRPGPVKWLMVSTPGAVLREDGLLQCDFMGTGMFCTEVAALKAMVDFFPERRFVYEDEDHKEKEMTELFPIGLVGPNTPEGRLRRIRKELTDESPRDIGQNGPETMLDRIRDILNTSHPTKARFLGEDYHFPVAPFTRVLGADWRWKQLCDFSVGEDVLSVDEFSPPHSSRRMQVSQITNVVKRELPEYRIITEARELLTTAEHPWLSIDSSNNPIKSKWLWTPTAKLTAGSVMARVVPVEVNPDLTSRDFMEGYVQGLIHSDGHQEKNGMVIVRMCDTQPLERLATFLANLGIESVRRKVCVFDNPNHRPQHCVGVYRRESFTKLSPIANQARMASVHFAAGYLSGMYDGDGFYAGTHMAIASKCEWKKDRINEAGRVLGFYFKRTPTLMTLCGNQSAYSFWMKTSPSMSRRMLPIGQIGNDGVKRTHEVLHRQEKILSIEATGRISEMWCPTTTTGTFIAEGIASHNCHLARKAGFKLWCDTKNIVGHVGDIVYPVGNDKLSVSAGIPTHTFKLDDW